jgi:hypothetical protein
MGAVMLIQHDRHLVRVDTAVDKDGDLHIRTTTSGIFLTPAEQDQLIQHLIEVRGVGRVQELLNQPWNGTERRA